MRIVNRRYTRQQRRRSSWSGGWVAVVLGFGVVLLGLVLLARVDGADDEHRRAVGMKIVTALELTNRADRALETANYGDARQQVKLVQATLTAAMGDLQQGAETR